MLTTQSEGCNTSHQHATSRGALDTGYVFTNTSTSADVTEQPSAGLGYDETPNISQKEDTNHGEHYVTIQVNEVEHVVAATPNVERDVAMDRTVNPYAKLTEPSYMIPNHAMVGQTTQHSETRGGYL